MPYTTLISAAELIALQARTDGPAAVVLDCGFDLADTTLGARLHAQGHLPGALHADLDQDLSGARTGRNGRHPLPDLAHFAARVGRWGITPQTQVVCYDDHGGVYAARAWWLLRWLGHGAVAVLDGGRAAWRAAGGSLVTDLHSAAAAPPYPAEAPAMRTVDAAALTAMRGHCRLLDARAPERFRGDVEPLDPVAGHIPGAINRFFKDNLAADGRFRPAAELRAAFQALGEGPSAGVVHQCGSGVTACHNLLAMAHAGLDAGALYPGSWSEWCSDPTRPVAKG